MLKTVWNKLWNLVLGFLSSYLLDLNGVLYKRLHKNNSNWKLYYSNRNLKFLLKQFIFPELFFIVNIWILSVAIPTLKNLRNKIQTWANYFESDYEKYVEEFENNISGVFNKMMTCSDYNYNSDLVITFSETFHFVTVFRSVNDIFGNFPFCKGIPIW